MSVLSLLVYIVILWAVISVWKNRGFIKMCVKIHGDPWSLPGIGYAYHWLRGGSEGRWNILQRCGRISIAQGGLTTLWIGPKSFIVVSEPEIAEIVLKTYLSKGNTMVFFKEFIGNSTFVSPAHIWRPRRKVMAPSFSLKILSKFVNIFDEQSKILVEQLKKEAEAGPFSLISYICKYTFDSVSESTLGVKINAQRQSNHPFLKTFETILPQVSEKALYPPIALEIYKLLPAYKKYFTIPTQSVWDFVDDIIKNKKEEMMTTNKKTQQVDLNDEDSPQVKTFLEMWIKSSGFNDVDLREEVLTLLLAGIDTSALATCYACLLMAQYPDVQEKVYEEINTVIGEIENPVTVGSISNLKYLEAVIKETLRLYPIGPIILRTACEDLKLPSGVTIVKGSEVLVHIWAVHRNPRYWGEDADQFRPERHIGITLAHPAAYMPFSYGPRSCTGYHYGMLSMKTALANLVRSFRILPATPLQDLNEPVSLKFEIMLKAADDFQVILEPRNKT